MGSSGAAGGGSGQRNDAIDCVKLKRGGEMMGGGGLAVRCNRWGDNTDLSFDTGRRGRRGEVKGNQVD
jgi:hypothetical protein